MENSKTVVIGNNAKTTKKMDNNKLKGILSKIGIGAAGVAGGALLSSPVVELINSVFNPKQTGNLPEPVIVVHDVAPEATQVTDDMSLKDAFAVAREEVGPGGVFVKNQVRYSTYTKEEEGVMTDEHKQQFAHSAGQEKVESSRISVEDIEVIPVENLQYIDDNVNDKIDTEVLTSQQDINSAEPLPAAQPEVAVSFVEPLDEMLADVPKPAVPAAEAVPAAQPEVAASFVEPLDEMLADVPKPVVPAAEPVPTAQPEVAATLVEPLDEMLADVPKPVVPAAEAVPAAQPEVAATLVEPLDEMLADVQKPAVPVAEPVPASQPEVAATLVEPLDEILFGYDNNLKLIGENWVSNEDGSRSRVVFYSQNDQAIIKIDQNNDGIFDTSMSIKSDGTVHVLTSNGEEANLSQAELNQILNIGDNENSKNEGGRETIAQLDFDGDGNIDSHINSNSDGEVHISTDKTNVTLILDDVEQLVDMKTEFHQAHPEQHLFSQVDITNDHSVIQNIDNNQTYINDDNTLTNENFDDLFTNNL